MTAADQDRPNRRLTEAEARDLEALRPALTLWHRYVLDTTACNTVAEAMMIGAPVVCVTRARGINPVTHMAMWPTMAVNLEAAYQRMCDLVDRRGLPAGVEVMPSQTQIVVALLWMGREHDSVRGGPEHQTSFVPVGEAPKRYRHRGWCLATGEVWWRLSADFYTPVRTPLLGRPPIHSTFTEQPAPKRTRLPVRGNDVEVISKVLRDYVQNSAPTCLLGTADAEHRPLVLRAPGRPRRDGSARWTPDSVLVSAEAVGLWAEQAGPRLGLPRPAGGWWTRQRAAALLTMLSKVAPEVAPVERASAPDSGLRRLRLLHWYQVSWSWAGVAPWREQVEARAMVDDELAEWNTSRARAVENRQAAKLAEAEAFAAELAEFDDVEATTV